MSSDPAEPGLGLPARMLVIHEFGEQMKLLRSVPILARSLTAFGLIVLMLLAIVVTTLVNGHHEDQLTRGLTEADATTTAAQQVKFRVSELGDAQARWALALVRGDTSALLDQSTTRSAVASASAAAFNALKALRAHGLNAGEVVMADDATTRYQSFSALDASALKGFRSTDADLQGQAERLVSLDAPELVSEVATDVDQLVQIATTRADKARHSASRLSNVTRVAVLALGIGSVILALALSALLTYSITRPLHRLHRSLADIADGDSDLTQRLEVSGHDEVAAVSATFNRFVDKLAATVASLSTSARALATASQTGSATATQLTAAAAETSRQAAATAEASGRVAHEIVSVASSIEETTAAVREIARNASHAVEIGRQAAAQAAGAAVSIGRLGESTQHISAVVALITGIARQTHLLALNARIQAAAAGEAGMSFAAVADEVKALADSTAQATQDILPTIASIQTDATTAVTSVVTVRSFVDQIAELQVSISGAVEETTATTAAMAVSAAVAANGSSDITESAAGVASAADSMTQGAAETERTAHELARLAAQLDGVAGQFSV